MKTALKQALMAMGLLVTLGQTAQAEGMNAPASLLPQGYVPVPAAAPAPATARDDAARSGMGEAELTQTEAMPSEAQAMNASGEGTGQADYVDVPPPAALEAMPQPAPQAMGQQMPGYTQGITTGPKAYSEGNFTFKAR